MWVEWRRAYNQATVDTWDEDGERKDKTDGEDHLVTEDMLLRNWLQQDAECNQLSIKDLLMLGMGNRQLFY